MDKIPCLLVGVAAAIQALSVHDVRAAEEDVEVTEAETVEPSKEEAPEISSPDPVTSDAAQDATAEEETVPDSPESAEERESSSEEAELEAEPAPSSESAVVPDQKGGSEEPAHAEDFEGAPAPAPPEEEGGWLNWPFAKERTEGPPREPHRWASVGALLGMSYRSSDSSKISYRPGVAWGGYIRPELKPWLGLRLFYREERIPVSVVPGAFDFEGDTYDDEFEQGDLEVLNLGARLEPTFVVHPRFRVRGIVGWSWLWFRAPHPTSDTFEMKRTFRSGVQMDVRVGAGLSFDLIENWLDLSLDGTYGITAARTGTAYEPAQVIRDGEVRHIAPLPFLSNAADVLLSLGVIL